MYLFVVIASSQENVTISMEKSYMHIEANGN